MTTAQWVKQEVKRAVRYAHHVDEEMAEARAHKKKGEPTFLVRHHVRWARKYNHELVKSIREIAEYLP